MASKLVGIAALLIALLAIGYLLIPYEADTGAECGPAAVEAFQANVTSEFGGQVRNPCLDEAHGRFYLSVVVLALTFVGSWVALRVVGDQPRPAASSGS